LTLLKMASPVRGLRVLLSAESVGHALIHAEPPNERQWMEGALPADGTVSAH
jgi:hypothetical protein